MCGIAGGMDCGEETVWRGVRALQHRGPDARGVKVIGRTCLGHARLSILDLSQASAQPFVVPGGMLAYNGELWNYKERREHLQKTFGVEFRTEGDTEVVAQLLKLYGSNALETMEWMGALAWTTDGERIILARDRFGEVPLHYSGKLFASERKALIAMGVEPETIEDLPPGEMAYVTSFAPTACGPYYEPPIAPCEDDMETAAPKVFDLVVAGARERAISDVPVCALLSGGIDSAAICYALAGILPGLVAYTAVMNKKSNDLARAREVAEFLGIQLIEVPVEAPTVWDMRSIVDSIEMPLKAQVEIAWACRALAKKMRKDGFRVTFSGEGSDELWASYGFSYHALVAPTRDEGEDAQTDIFQYVPDTIPAADWHAYRRDLVIDQGRKNFARCNKIFLEHGVECRLPFLHRPLVEYALSLRKEAVQAKGRPKAVLQEAFRGVLPKSVVDRPKVAFQVGMGLREAIAESLVGDPRMLYRRFYNDAYGPREQPRLDFREA